MLAAAIESKGYFKYAMKQSQQHHDSLLAQPLSAEKMAEFEAGVQESLAEHARVEAQPQENFEDYVASYYA